jgi:feruloyl esterase
MSANFVFDRLALAVVTLVLTLIGSIFVSPSAGHSGKEAVDPCGALLRTAIADTELLSTAVIASNGDLPEYCRVRGYVRPAIHFEARLPTRSWNRKLYASGCGGFCGEVLADRPGYSNGINVALVRGYAAVTTDSGHWGGKVDATWAYHDRQAEIDFAYRSIGEIYRVASVLLAGFYSETPRYRYFAGCSNGGRMAAMAAQRYPDLFDGILSGAPVLEISKAGAIYGAWLWQADTGAEGGRIFRHEMLDQVTEEVVRTCDGLDGLEDGLINDPRRCPFDPSTLQCGEGRQATDCLAPEEVAALAKWYEGPRNSSGEQLFPGVPRGSEPFWPVWLLGSSQAPPLAFELAKSYLRFVGFESDPGPTYSPGSFDFDRDPPRLEFMGRLLDADNPDLGPFRAAGGKLIMYQGWADPVVVPEMTTSYYEKVIDAMGSYGATADFFRLFMIPGMGHCWELPGTGPDRFDPIQALEAWVENGVPPDRILAAQQDADGNTIRTRPLCPYPQVARYRGSGSTESADSFRCVEPRRRWGMAE